MAWRSILISNLRGVIRVPKAMRYPAAIAGLIVLGVTVWLTSRMLWTATISGDVILLISILLLTGLTLLAAGGPSKDV